MNICRLSFILYFFKLSDGPGFWYNLRNDNNISCKKAIKLECLAKKLKKRELDLKFLPSFRDTGVYSKFMR